MRQESIHYTNSNDSRKLQDAFRDFNDVSNHLTDIYSNLEQQVAALNQELTSVRDAREQETAEKVLLAKRLQNLLNVMPAGVIVLDKEGRIQEHNPAATDLFSSELIEEKWLDIVERSFAPQVDDGHDVTLVDGRCVNISTQSLQDENGQLILVKEVTEAKRLQQQLDRLKRLSAMGDMASSLAHQVRTPLSTALLYASHLSRTDLDEEKQSRFVNKLVARLKHLESLIEDMLLFARGGRFDSQPISVKALVSEFYESIESKVEEAHAKLEIENNAPDTIIDINKNTIISIFQNLLENSINASDQGLTLSLSVNRKDKKNLLIKFSDDGPGIDPDMQEKIFEPFFTTSEQGTGLGLTVAEAVIRAHGGQIRVNRDVKQGACFDIILPIKNLSVTGGVNG